MSPSASSSTLYSSPVEANDEESDVSSEWDASSEDEEDKKEQKVCERWNAACKSACIYM